MPLPLRAVARPLCTTLDTRVVKSKLSFSWVTMSPTGGIITESMIWTTPLEAVMSKALTLTPSTVTACCVKHHSNDKFGVLKSFSCNFTSL